MPNPPRPPARAIACPRCGDVRRLEAPPNLRLRCPACRAEYRAPAFGAATVPAAPAEPEPAQPPPAPAAPKPAPAGSAGPTVIDVAGVRIRPAPPPEPGREPVPEPPAAAESAQSSPDELAPRADENGKPAQVHRTAGRDRRPIRRQRLWPSLPRNS